MAEIDLPRALDGLDTGTLTAGLAARPTIEAVRLAVTATAALVEALVDALPAAGLTAPEGLDLQALRPALWAWARSLRAVAVERSLAGS